LGLKRCHSQINLVQPHLPLRKDELLDRDFEGRDPEEYILAKDSGAPWYVNDSSYSNAFSKKLNKLGILGKQPWHAFRHTGAIELFEITGDIYIVKTFLRHELIETTKRYLNSNRVNHVVEENMNLIGTKFVKTVRNQEPKNKLLELNPNPKLLEVA